MQIKKIGIENVKEVYELSLAELGEDSWSLSQFMECIDNKDYIFYLNYSEKTLVSFLVAMQLIDSVNLLLIATRSSHKNKGLASQLIEFLQKNVNSKIWLEVKENNLPAISLYKKLGFKQIYTRKKYYKDGTSALVFEKICS